MTTPPDGAAPGLLPCLEIVRPGMLTTVQDLGRPGFGRFGVSPSGAMDPFAHQVANLLCGNAPDSPALEITGPGAELRFLAACRFAIAGGDLDARLGEAPLAPFTAALAREGDRLTFASRRSGARVTLALAGGITAPALFGSAATDLGAGVGGLDGKPLKRGQMLLAAPAASGPASLSSPRAVLTAYEDPHVLRFVPEDDPHVSPAARAQLAAAPLRVSDRSNRTGYRFTGAPLPVLARTERLSEPTAPGAIQLPPDGFPILLMADRNTTGGYPRLGHLASADRPKAAQLWPGDEIRFVPVSLEDATHAARALTAVIEAFARAIGQSPQFGLVSRPHAEPQGCPAPARPRKAPVS